MTERLIEKAQKCGARVTHRRAAICKVIEQSNDHPDVIELHERARELEPKVSLATVYRNVRFLEEHGLIVSQDFGDGRLRYEIASDKGHFHLVDETTGKVLEFDDDKVVALLNEAAKKMGYSLTHRRVELKGTRIGANHG